MKHKFHPNINPIAFEWSKNTVSESNIKTELAKCIILPVWKRKLLMSSSWKNQFQSQSVQKFVMGDFSSCIMFHAFHGFAFGHSCINQPRYFQFAGLECPFIWIREVTDTDQNLAAKPNPWLWDAPLSFGLIQEQKWLADNMFSQSWIVPYSVHELHVQFLGPIQKISHNLKCKWF